MSGGIDVLFVLDPLERLDPLADSSHVMITEALRRGHRPYGARIEDLAAVGGRTHAHAVPLRLAEVGRAPARVVPGDDAVTRGLASFAVVLMRKDPPVDQAYLAATWLLDQARDETLVINDPRGLRDLNEKLSILAFPELIPKTVVARDPAELRLFLDDVGGTMIVKPIYGFGGREILMAKRGDPNLSTILEIATADATTWTVAQEYLPAARQGDKRILLVDGEAIGAVLRVPSSGELRNNFHTGGTPANTDLDDRDRAICSAIGPYLRERGQFFVGIDVIGGLLTEINVTSPTGMQEINRLSGAEADQTMQARFWAALESKLGVGT